MKSFKQNRWLFIFLGMMLGIVLSHPISFLHAFSENVYKSLEQFAKVLYYVENDYVDKVDEKNLLQGGIKGMLGTLDPHTLFLTPDIYKDLKVDTVGKFGGVGLEVTLKDGILTVVSPIEDTPASKAGIKPGDRLLKIDGHSTKDMNLTDAVRKMRGARNSKVVISIFREGWKEPHDISLVRENISVKSIKGELIENKYAYARIASFQERTKEDLEQLLTQYNKTSGGLKGIILDLRNDPGGLLDQAVEVSGLFIKEGPVVSMQGRSRKTEVRKVTGKAPYPTLPIAVLVNGGSASAAEIVAGALQDYNRGYLIGTQTFGKGTVQTVIDIGDNSGLKLTVARYFTPKNRQIDGKGLTPNLVVALKEPETKSSETKPKIKPLPESLQEDNQKQAAINYLKKIGK